MRGNVQVAVRGGEVGQLEQSRPGLLPYINVVIDTKPKMLRGLTKGYVAGSRVRSSLDADSTATGEEAGPTPCTVHMRNVVNRTCSSQEESESQGSSRA